MKRQGKRKAQAPAESPSKNKGIGIDEIVATLSSFKDMSKDAAQKAGYRPDAVNREVLACEAATDILTALQDEGIEDPEQVRDLINGYNALAEQYQKMHQQYEDPEPIKRLGNLFLCPACKHQVRHDNPYCWYCGKRLGWGR